MNDREEKIRQRVHAIWESEGRPEGMDQAHWERAAGEIDGGVEPAGDDAPLATKETDASKAKPSDTEAVDKTALKQRRTSPKQ